MSKDRGERIMQKQAVRERVSKYRNINVATPADVSKLCENPKPCSCPMCGNPRKNKGFKPKDRVPLRERRNQQEDKFDVDGWTDL